ncbi:rod shape-determining protein MreC [Lancefieldella parvula DSM 20469]|uniref:Cell shape-determining protein MreC n=1 Tax=Lancefieldella parvula (strain ATCC 33793 / DSM 20469 / CCUG 32760 / JCM 10300 / KCTC 3663 / VPI 0546 / 1246) TaxID=521095 RepID=C8WAG2_LANP1|nr:rod shape-determining protein MreC [Lancefieldella parvula]ACV51100.1 rod shape-determining protein MreC [Lancefieldella parvula DSM 20469]
MPLSNQIQGASSGLGSNNNKHTGGRSFIILSLLSIVLLTVSARMGTAGPLEMVRGGFSTITMPFRMAGSAIAMPFQGIGNIFSNLTADQQTLSDLKAENEQLRSRNAELEETNQSTQRLQGLLDLKNNYNLQSTGARVISGSTDSFNNTIVIDKGTSSGLAVGMPVVDSGGVIGQIIECGSTTSTVRLITDEKSGVAAMVQSSRAQGMLMGSASRQITLNLINTNQKVAVGDTVVTSGLGGVFPKGLPLGKVTSVEAAPGSIYYTIVIEPYGNVSSNEEVMVITSLSEEQKATADDIAEADKQNTPTATDSDSKDKDSKDSSSSNSSSGSTSTTNSQQNATVAAPTSNTQHNSGRTD